MQRDIQALNELLKIDSTEALERALLKIITGLGFDKFAYYSELNNNSNEVPIILTNYQDEWIAHYRANNYGEIDPVHIEAKKTMLPMQWGGDEYLKCLSRQQRKLFKEAEEYNICVGLTIPVHSPTRFSSLTVAAANKNLIFQNHIQESESYLQLLALTFCEAFHIFLSANQLTKRERGCLCYIAKRYNYDATAIKMQISSNTVLYFAKNIRQKLDVRSIQHAVAIAKQRNLIEY